MDPSSTPDGDSPRSVARSRHLLSPGPRAGVRRNVAIATVVSLLAVLFGAFPALGQSQNEVLINVLYDGTDGWTDGEPTTRSGSLPEPHGPGLDGGPQNGVVRTWDQFAVRVDWNVNEEDATGVALTVVLPDFAEWLPDQSGMFAGCDPATSTFPNPQTVVCELGDQPEGSNGVIRPVALLREPLDNTVFDVIATLTTDDDPGGVSDDLDEDLTASEGPNVDYIKAEPTLSPLVNNGTEDGYVALFPLTFVDYSQAAQTRGAGPIDDAVPVPFYDHLWNLTPSVRLASAAEMTAAGFTGTSCGDYTQTGPFVAGNGSWACGAPTVGAGGYPVVPITVNGFTSRPAPTNLANGSVNSAAPQISSGQIVVWLSASEVSAAILDPANPDPLVPSTGSAEFDNSDTDVDDTAVIASPDDVVEPPAFGTSGPATTGPPDNNTTSLGFGDRTTTGGGGVTMEADVEWEVGPLQLQESTRHSATGSPRYNVDMRPISYGGSAQLPGANRYWHGSADGTSDYIGQVARGQLVTISSVSHVSPTEGLANDAKLHGCMAFENSHYDIVPFGTIDVAQVSPVVVSQLGATTGGYTTTSNTGPLAHFTAGSTGWLDDEPDYGQNSAIGVSPYDYVVEFSNGPTPIVGNSFGITNNNLTCDDADGGTSGWVDANDAAALAAAFDPGGDGRYEGITRARYSIVDNVNWYDAATADGGDRYGMRVYFQAQVKQDLNVNTDNQELFVGISRSYGDRDPVTGTPDMVPIQGTAPTNHCLPNNGVWNLNSGNTDTSTTGWCNNRFVDEPTATSTFDDTDVVEIDIGAYWANSVHGRFAYADVLQIVGARPAVKKTNLDGLDDIKDNEQLVQFKISPSVIGAEVEAVTNVRVGDVLPSYYEFVRFVDYPDVAHDCSVSGQTVSCQYSDPSVPFGDDAVLPAGLPGGWPGNSPAGCTPGTDCVFEAADASFTIEVMVTGAVANSDSATVLTNTARADSSGLGPWDPAAQAFSQDPVDGAQNASASASSFMPLPADEGAIIKALDTFEGDCVRYPDGPVDASVLDPEPADWGDRCEMVDLNGDMSFLLSLENDGNTAFNNIEIVDVFPHDGDEVEPVSATPGNGGSPSTLGDGRTPESDFVGTLEYVSMVPVTTPAGTVTTTYVSGDDPATISRDPAVSKLNSTWCDAPGGTVVYGSGTCPAAALDVTATFTHLDGPLLPDDTVDFRLTLDSEGVECDDIWTNTFGARVDEILLPVRSNDVSIMVNCEYDLALRKTLDPGWTPDASWLESGASTVDFVIEVHNQGDPVNNFEVTDYVDPAMFVFHASLNAGGNTVDALGLPFTWDSSGANPVVTVNDPTHPLADPNSNLIMTGAVLLVPVTLTVAPGFTGSDLDNYAEISYFDNDNDPSNGDSDPANPANSAGGPLVDTDSLPDGSQGDTLVDDVIDSDITQGGADEDDHDIALVPVWDLAIDKALGASQGGIIDVSTTPPTVTFDVTVTNEGTMDAFFVDILDTPPPGLTFNSSTAPTTTSGGAAVAVSLVGPNMWTIDMLVAGDSVTIPVVFDVTDLTLSPYVNSVQITDFDDDADLATPDADTTQDVDSSVNNDTDHTQRNEDDDDVAEVALPYDLALRKRLDPTSPDLADGLQDGDRVTFNIEVHNQLAPVESFDVTDYIQAGWEPFDLSLQPLTTSAGTVSGLPVSWSSTNPLTPVASVTGGLGSGEHTIVQIVLVADIPNTPATVLDNLAEISAFDNDTDSTNTAPVDVDSTPDGVNDDILVDDDIDSDVTTGGPDEDDHDIASTTWFDVALTKDLWDGATCGDGPLAITAATTSVEYCLTVTNEGPSDVYSVSFADTPPAGLVFGSTTDLPAGVVDDGNGAYTATVIAPGASYTVRVEYTLDLAAVAGPLTNVAEVSAMFEDAGGTSPAADVDSFPDATPDGDAPTEDDEDSEALVLPFDLALQKQLIAVDGDLYTFAVTVTNQSISVMNLDVTDYIDSSMWEPFNPSLNAGGLTGGTAANQFFYNWDASNPLKPVAVVTPVVTGDMFAAGETVDLEITLQLKSDFAGTELVNWAEISDFDDNGDPGDGTGADGTLVDVDSTPDGIDGNGPGENPDVTNVDDDITGDGTAGGDEDDHDQAYAYIFDLALRKTLDATATVTPVVPGGDVVFMVEVFNQGTAHATDITLVDYVDLAMWAGFDAAAQISGGMTGGDQTLPYSWTASGTDGALAITGTLAPGESVIVPVTLTVAAMVVPGAELLNTAEIDGATPVDAGGISITLPDGSPLVDIDSVPDATNDDLVVDDEINGDGTVDEDDHDVAPITLPSYDLALIKSLTSVNDTEATFTVTVTNQGEMDSGQITVTDTIPVGMAFVSADNGGTETAAGSGVVVWTIPNIAVGGSTDLSITVDAVDLTQAPYMNNAAITGAPYVDEDSDPTDGNVEVIDRVVGDEGIDVEVGDTDDHDIALFDPGSYDLALIKTLSSADETEATFTVTVANQGDLNSGLITITDMIPAGTVFVSADNGGTETAAGSGVVEWLVANVSSGATKDLSITVEATDLSLAPFVNDAAITDAPYADEDSDPADANTDVIDRVAGDEGIDEEPGDTDDHDIAVFDPGAYDMALIKTLALVTGAEATFTVTVTNQGALSSGQLIITDTIPVGTTFVSADGGGSETAPGSGVVVWSIPNIAVGGSTDLSITVAAVDLTQAPFVNNAAITAAPFVDEDSDPSDDNADVIERMAGDESIDEEVGDTDDHDIASFEPGSYDLALIKTVVAVAGTEATFRVTVTNQGDIDSGEITITDTIPAGTLFVSADQGGTETASLSGVVEWTIPNIPAGGSQDLSIRVNAVDLTQAPFVNNAAITAAPFADEDSDPTDDNVDVIDRVAGDESIDEEVGDTDDHDIASFTPVYDLALIKYLDAVDGLQATFVVTVTNQGAADSGQITVTDTLPPGTMFVSTNSGGVETAAGSGVVEWTIGNIAAGVSIDLQIVIEATDPTLMPYINEAAITNAPYTDEDSDPTDANTDVIDRVAGDEGIDEEAGDTDDHDIAEFNPGAYDLALIKTLDSANGAEATFVVTVSNQGGLDSGQITVTDTLPAGTAFVSATNGGAETAAGVVEWIVPNIAVGEFVNLEVTIEAVDPSLMPYVNSAAITDAPYPDEDSDPADDNADVIDRGPDDRGIDSESGDTDDHDIASWAGGPVIDLELDKVLVTLAPYAAGDVVEYRVTVQNRGPDRAQQVEVVDSLPAGLSYVSSSDYGAYANNANTVTWTIPTIPAGSSVDLTIRAEIDADATGDLTNFAEITDMVGTDIDSTPGENPLDGSNPPDEDEEAKAVLGLASQQLPPVAIDQSTSTAFNTPVTLDAQSMSTDPDGTVARIELIDPATGNPHPGDTITIPGQGTWEILLDGRVEFTPETGFTGNASIPYRAIDNDGLPSAPALLTVTVEFPQSLPFTGRTLSLLVLFGLALTAAGGAHLASSRKPAVTQRHL